MKDLIIKLVQNSDRISGALSDLDTAELERGQLSLGYKFVESLLCIFEDDRFKIRSVSIDTEGVSLSISYDRMILDYTLEIKMLSVGGGKLNGEILYRERRQGGGIGNALLGVSGKSGLSMALGRKKWCRVDRNTVFLNSSGLPENLYLKYLGVKEGRLCFKIN